MVISQNPVAGIPAAPGTQVDLVISRSASAIVSVIANPLQGGTVSGGGSYTVGEQVVISAMAADGYTFLNWCKNGETLSTDSDYSLVADSNVELVANFVAQISDKPIVPEASQVLYKLDLSAVNGSANGAGSYRGGDKITIAATPDKGYEFANWTGSDGKEVSDLNPYTLIMPPHDLNLIANFTEAAQSKVRLLLTVQTYSVNVTAINGSVSGSGDYEANASVSLTATAADGYEFLNWTDATGSQVSTDNPYLFSMPAQNVSLTANFREKPKAPGNIIFVMHNASGANNGTSWTNAFQTLTDALVSAAPGSEIWVAAGTYYPTSGSERSACFSMKNGVGIYGGFAGNEIARDQRSWQVNITTLSGDIGNPGSIFDNCYHVFYHQDGLSLDNSAVLDGFTITGALANGSGSDEKGGGMLNMSSSPKLVNLIVNNNFASEFGGAMYNNNSSPEMFNVQFTNNRAGNMGGAVYNNGGCPRMDMISCTANFAYVGGCMYNNNSNPTIINAGFYHNCSSLGQGGAVANYSSSPTFVNAAFYSNASNSTSYGGGMSNEASSPTLINNTFSSNSAGQGGGVYNDGSSRPTITNSILWGNTRWNTSVASNIFNEAGAACGISYSLVEGCGGSGPGWLPDLGIDNGCNLDADPCFVDASSALRPQNTSPAVNAGNSALVTTAADLGGSTRIVGSAVDMGAHENQEVIGPPPGSNIIYVKHDAAGANDGTCWVDAFTTLSAALSTAVSGKEIWVAAGAYYPTGNNDRSMSFQMKKGVAVYGGFAGTETERGQRNWLSHQTILSGDLAQNDVINGVVFSNTDDNSYHVFCHSSLDLDSTAILDGFTISGGNANGASNADKLGGGMYNYMSSPTVLNTIFKNNCATHGGGMFNQYCNPVFTDLTFSYNRAVFGGGMFNNTDANPILTNLTFSNNLAEMNGGGMENVDNNITLNGATFSNNQAELGGGIFDHNDINKVGRRVINNVSFNSNKATVNGGGLYTTYVNFALTDVTFSGNSAKWGGGMYVFNSREGSTLSNTIFEGNAASEYGGGMYNDNGGLELSNVSFQNNTAGKNAGGFHNYCSKTVKLTGVVFNNNRAQENGGGMYSFFSSPRLVNVKFINNNAQNDGGGMCCFNGGTPSLTNVVFYGNSANWGGGLNNYGTTLNLDNGTLYGNTAVKGGGISNSTSRVGITNSILWGNQNTSGGSGPQLFSEYDSSVDISYSLIQGYGSSGSTWAGSPAYEHDLGHNIDANPQFENAAAGTLRLLGSSPAIDQGNSGAVPVGVVSDIDGNSRISGSAVDMGAYEYQSVTAVYTLTLSANPTAGGSATDNTHSGPYLAGAKVMVSAAANSGYDFVNWTVGGIAVSTAASFTYTMPAQDTSLVANFKSSAPAGGGGGGGGGSTPAKEKVEVKTDEVKNPAPPDLTIVLTVGSNIVLVNGREVVFDAAPYIEPGVDRAMIPVALIALEMGARVEWLEDNWKVKIKRGDKEIILTIGSRQALVNGEPMEMETDAVIVDDRTFVPLRFVNEALGAKVEWDETTRKITITYKK